MNDELEISALILAAGIASRMGETKQLLKLNGKPLIQHVIHQVQQEDFNKIAAVIGFNAMMIKESVPISNSRFEWIINKDYQKGKSTSLQKGLQKLPTKTAHVMVFLGDLPLIKQQTISCIYQKGYMTAKKLNEPFVIRPVYQGKYGHPVFFGHIDRNFFHSLKDDQGAKRMIQDMHHFKKLHVLDEGIIQDMDTLLDYDVVRNKLL